MTGAPPGFRGAFHTAARARALYSEGAGPFRLVPAAVALPRDADDLCLLLRWATAHDIALTPRGAGSGMPGGNLGSGVIVDLRGLDAPPRVHPGGTASAGAAMTWQALDAAARPLGLRLPPDPSSGAFATLGGMVATNAAGARSLAHGSMRRWVRGVQLATAEGDLCWLRRGVPAPANVPATARAARLAPALAAARPLITRRFPATTKNTAGYALDAWLESGDLLDLIIGSEGTLGVVTAVELTLDRVPAAVATRRVAVAALDALPATVAALRAAGATAIELLDRSFLDLVGETGDAAAILLADFEGPAAPEGATDDVERRRLWALRHAASPVLARLPESRRSLQVIEDGCVPLPRLAEYVRGVHAAAARRAIPIVAFGHAGDGHLHVNALADVDAPDLTRRLLELRDAVADLVIGLGGTPSGEHGDGRLRAPLLDRLYGTEVLQLFARIKAAFDPAGILNPGVILPHGPLPPFKAGPDAPALVPGVAGVLRARERAARYGVAPLALEPAS